MFIDNHVFDQSEMRCRKFWWADYNPSVTEHWFFDKVLKRPDIAFLRTTYKQNKHISIQERNKILSYEPWKQGSYMVKDNIICCYNKLTNKVEPISKTNIPPPHPDNIDNGTADEYMWKVYGLGLRGTMKGIIFSYVEWIDKFPDDMTYIYGNDFGFTTDPNATVKYAEDEKNIWIEALCYQPIETESDLADFFVAAKIDKDAIVACDSSDKYTSESKGTIEMVKGLKKLGWKKAFKISKTKGVLYWVNSMKKRKFIL
ncbi:hypothetical protein [Flavobacterium oreochromis]|uniref:hypothetical protein n=1 Tax=Flavobacterium oreochromis TaxID=2906078 RepID=UPI0021649489|nr:hypothetical protein [Flavobacterium oreochromis]